MHFSSKGWQGSSRDRLPDKYLHNACLTGAADHSVEVEVIVVANPCVTSVFFYYYYLGIDDNKRKRIGMLFDEASATTMTTTTIIIYAEATLVAQVFYSNSGVRSK